ncbi:MAG TPA: hypothetical protein V6D47_10580 [Oscillatoriaceae cyanobacterium]
MTSQAVLLDAGRVAELIDARIIGLQTIARELPEYLVLLQNAAEGRPVARDAVLHATGQILDILYRGVLSPRTAVSRDFWESPMGLAIARAHARVVPDGEVVSQAEAAELLGVSREYVSQLVEAGKVRTIVREASAPRSRLRPREMLYRDSLGDVLAKPRRKELLS